MADNSSKRISLTYVVNARMPTDRAHGVQIVHTCEALGLAGIDVELLVPMRFNAVKGNTYDYYSVSRSFKIKRIPSLDLLWFGPIGYWIQEHTFALSALLYLTFSERKQSIIYARGEGVFKVLSRLYKKRKVFLETHVRPRDLMRHWSIYKRAAGVTVVTKFYQQELIKEGFSPSQVLWAPDGVDLRLFDSAKSFDKEQVRADLKLPKERFIVGYVGKITTLGKSKGVEELIRIFMEVHASEPSSFFLIVGATAEELAFLTQTLLSYGLDGDSFKVVGHVLHASALSYMQACDILTMNYPNSGHYVHYMSPLKLFEYMASGTPVVTSDLPCVRDILSERNAVLVAPNDTQAFAKAIINLIRDTQHADRIAKQAKEDVERYSWEVRAGRIINFISHADENSTHN